MAKTAILKIDILSDFDNRGMQKAAGSFDGLHKAATVASGAIVGGFAAGAAKAVKDASALSESVNAVDKVFGSAAGSIEDYGKTASASAGLSERAFNELATNTGSLLQNLGYDAEAAADSTITLAERSADMASVFNTDVKSAMDAVNAALRGSNEPLLAYGVNIDAASTKAKALELGLWDGVGAMSSHAEAAAIEAQILEQTANVAGDFADTSDSLANRQRQLAADTENVSAQMGEALLPIMESLVGILQSAVEWISQNEALFKALVATLTGLAASYLAITTAVKGYRAAKDLATAAQKLFTNELVVQAAKTAALNAKTVAYKATLLAWEGAQKLITKATKLWAAAQKILNIALKANPIGLVVTIITALVAIVVKAYQESEVFRAIVDKIGQLIKNLVIRQFERFVNIIKRVVEWVRKAWDWVRKLIDKLRDIKMPTISFPSLPWNRSGTLTLRDATGRSAARAGRAEVGASVNIYVSGAIDPVGTAEQIQSILDRQRIRMGAPITVWEATT